MLRIRYHCSSRKIIDAVDRILVHPHFLIIIRRGDSGTITRRTFVVARSVSNEVVDSGKIVGGSDSCCWQRQDDIRNGMGGKFGKERGKDGRTGVEIGLG